MIVNPQDAKDKRTDYAERQEGHKNVRLFTSPIYFSTSDAKCYFYSLIEIKARAVWEATASAGKDIRATELVRGG